MPYKLYVLVSAMLIASGATALAQGVMAPGPALPGNAGLAGVNPGGIGPGLTSVAPGRATGPMIENQGPAGVPLAIGSHDSTRPSVHRAVK
ncbi:MAG: hypothetical protein J2P54_04835 [Bradyrhizobiaceae bacterium]|nr:hypothetical protein [Bradyrhizobiaceae bacterium]